MTIEQTALLQRQSSHIAAILLKIAIAAISILIVCSLLPLFTVLFSLICLVLIGTLFCVTIGLILVIEPYGALVKGWFDLFIGGTELSSKVWDLIPVFGPIVGGVGIAAAALSVVLSFLDRKNRRSVVRIVIASIVLIVVSVLTVLVVAGIRSAVGEA